MRRTLPLFSSVRSGLLTMAKRKALSPLTPSMSNPVSRTSSRRSSRAVPRKSYAHDELMNDPDVFGDPLDREASPDQTSELSAPPSDLDLTEPPSDLDDDGGLSDTSVLVKKPVNPKKKPSTQKSKKESSCSPAKTRNRGSPSKVEVKSEVKDEEVEYDSDGEPIEQKGPTKADKHRARDAKAAEKYAEYADRPPTFDSDYVPVPFKGRLGYACLNTILRSRKDPVFCSRTTRLATIAKEDKGMPFVFELGRQNAADLSKMLEWNEKYGIRFFRLSSEMFPFSSHADYVYNLEHADAELRAAGALANKYDHRITCHPGQFTQIASPNPKIFDSAVRDLEFHNELLTRLRLEPESRDRDAVMILHLGGAYGDKAATLERFRTNYVRLSEPVRRRLVLENDDMSWSVTDLLPLCQELNIPLVLDWHHHNIVRDEERFREGSLDILPLLPAIAETWTRKNIKQKMHISEARLPNHPLPSQRRSHSARVYRLPPCADDMDIMIEAKDKEQAVFELSKHYNLNNPPLPPEVVGDGPGAKGDEAYWPEGEVLRLKTTKTRVKKEPELDSEAEEIKPSPKKRASAVKKEPGLDSEGGDIKPSPKKRAPRVKKESEVGSEGEEIKPSPKKRVKKATASKKGGIEGSSADPDEKDVPSPIVPQNGTQDRSENTPSKKTEKQSEGKEETKPTTRKGRTRKNVKVKVEEGSENQSVAATGTELRTGLTAKEIVNEAFERVQSENLPGLRRSSRSQQL